MNVQPGQTLVAVVQIDDAWITANFKETQLERMKVGQPRHHSRGRLRPRLSRQGGELGGRDGRAIQSFAAGKCHRQLREGCAAGTREDRARSESEQRSSAAAGNVCGTESLGEMSEAVSAMPARQLYVAPAINPWFIALTVTLATFMEVLDTSIANVSLPHIAGGLGAGVDESTWILTSYLVSNAIVLPMSGWISSTDRTQALLHGLRGALHDQFVSLRAGAQPGEVDFFQGSAGRGRRRPAAQRTIDSGGYVRAGEARNGFRCLRNGRGRRSRDRSDAGRIHYRQLQLALDLLHQRSDRNYLHSAYLADHHRSTAFERCAARRRNKNRLHRFGPAGPRPGHASGGPG